MSGRQNRIYVCCYQAFSLAGWRRSDSRNVRSRLIYKTDIERCPIVRLRDLTASALAPDASILREDEMGCGPWSCCDRRFDHINSCPASDRWGQRRNQSVEMPNTLMIVPNV